MQIIFAIILLVALLAYSRYVISNLMQNCSNTKFKSLIYTISNFVIVMMIIICLPLFFGLRYIYNDPKNMINFFFGNVSLSLIVIIPILCFGIATIYFAKGAYEIHCLNREKATQDKIDDIVLSFTPDKIQIMSRTRILSVDSRFINKEVVSLVRTYKSKLKEKVPPCLEIDSMINRILSCDDCNSVCEEYAYLQKNLSTLSQLKSISDKKHNDLFSRKIQLLNENSSVMDSLSKAFYLLKQSKKCVSDRVKAVKIEDFIISEKPNELTMFQYKCSPVILCIDAFFYCLFSNVILVFDSDGVFSTALDPSAMKITVESLKSEIHITNGKSEIGKFIGSDSKCIKHGDTRITWLHTCRDGTPDLRYSNNPRIEHRTDVYEYGRIAIKIAEHSLSYTISSHSAIKAFELISKEYPKRYNNLHNPIPGFLLLLKSVSDADEEIQVIENMVEIVGKRAESENYFCKEVISSEHSD